MQDSLFSQPRPPAQPPVEPVQGVSRVVDYIRRIISQNKTLAGIRVRGEVSGLSNKNGRLYFDLKENTDVLKCVVWASDAQKLPPFKDGDEIICGGDYGTFAQRSQYQLFVKSVEPDGALGSLRFVNCSIHVYDLTFGDVHSHLVTKPSFDEGMLERK